MFLLGWSAWALAMLLVAHYLPVKYVGVAKFTRQVDPASERLQGVESESFETHKLMLRNDLAGYRAVEKIIEDLKLTQNLPRMAEGRLTLKAEQDKQEMVRDMMKRITVTWEVSSQYIDLIAVSCEHPDPDLATSVPNALVHNYIALVSEKIVTRLRQSEEFLKDQRTLLKEQCDSANTEKIKFETEHSGAMPTSVGALDEQICRITTDLCVVRHQRNVAEAKLARFQTMMMGTRPASIPATDVAPTSPDGGRVDLSVEIATAQSEKETLSKLLEGMEGRLNECRELRKSFGPVLLKHNEFAKKLQGKEAELKGWDARYTEIQMALAAESAKKRTVHEAVLAAQPQSKPSSPSLLIILAISLCGGIVPGLVLALLRVRLVLRGRVLLLAWVAVLLLGVGVATLSNILWLERPDQYQEFRKSPVGYLATQFWDHRPR